MCIMCIYIYTHVSARRNGIHNKGDIVYVCVNVHLCNYIHYTHILALALGTHTYLSIYIYIYIYMHAYVDRQIDR